MITKDEVKKIHGFIDLKSVIGQRILVNTNCINTVSEHANGIIITMSNSEDYIVCELTETIETIKTMLIGACPCMPVVSRSRGDSKPPYFFYGEIN